MIYSLLNMAHFVYILIGGRGVIIVLLKGKNSIVYFGFINFAVVCRRILFSLSTILFLPWSLDRVFIEINFYYFYMGRADSTVPFYCIQRSIAYQNSTVFCYYCCFQRYFLLAIFFLLFVSCRPIQLFQLGSSIDSKIPSTIDDPIDDGKMIATID